MTLSSLWQPLTLGRLDLSHRLALAPMTPKPLQPGWYAGRLGGGIYTPEHVKGWRSVTEAVHARGGAVFIQLMHVGRMSHPDNTPHHRQPVAPSAISADQDIFTPTGPQKTPTPRELSMEDIQTTVADFRLAAASAIAAGADGVEIHGANGYLLHQFLSPNANHRTDAYGGSIENLSRFVIELAQALADEIGADRVGIRSPPPCH
jgi:N-ethylmaleimide reductase